MQKKPVRFATLSMKIWLGLVAALMSVTLLLVITLSNMAPQLNVIPQVFPKDAMNFNQFAEVTNIANIKVKDKEGKLRYAQVRVKESDLIDEMLVRFYIENRNGFVPDFREMDYRYAPKGPLARLTTAAIHRQLMKKVADYKQDKQAPAKTVDILSVKRIDNTFTVDFDVYQSTGLNVVPLGRRRATVRIEHNGKFRYFGRHIANPYGFVITYYAESGLKKR